MYDNNIFVADEFYQYIIVYRVQLFLAIISLIINFMISIYAFLGDAFQSYTTMFRAIIIIDILCDVCYLFDAGTSLLNRNFLL